MYENTKTLSSRERFDKEKPHETVPGTLGFQQGPFLSIPTSLQQLGASIQAPLPDLQDVLHFGGRFHGIPFEARDPIVEASWCDHG